MSLFQKSVAAMLAVSFLVLAVQNVTLNGERHRAALLEQEMAVENKRFHQLRHRLERVRKQVEPSLPMAPDTPVRPLKHEA